MTKLTGIKETIGVIAIKCDRCGNTHEDPMEMQEFLSWSDTCGYGNKTYGDMTRISIDLCQYCVKDTLGEWIRTLPELSFSEIT